MNKQAYEYLNSVRVLHWRWLRLKARHDELESCLLPAAIRYDKDKVQTSPEDQMSKIMAEISELEDQMKSILLAKAERIEDINNTIHSLESDEERTALTMRYINRIPVADIAEAMGYSIKRIYQFMDKGGTEISRTLKLERLETLENHI
jgi:DNA-directed RNA polymerase specialized sigma24 family protein